MLNTAVNSNLCPTCITVAFSRTVICAGLRLGNVGEGASARKSCMLALRTWPIGFSLATKGSCWEPEFSVTGVSNPPEMLEMCQLAVVENVMHVVAKSEGPSKSGRAGKSRIAHTEAFWGAFR